MLVVIGPAAQVPLGEGRNFVVAGFAGPLRVAVFRTRAGRVFATQADCPHRGGPLADGLVDDSTVICPLHDRVYSLATGAGVGNNCSLRVFPVQQTEDGTLVLVVASDHEMTLVG